MAGEPLVEGVDTRVYRVPTEAPESDGTLEWDATTMVLVEARAAGIAGLGYSYTSAGAATVVREQLVPCVCGESAFDVTRGWHAMVAAVRNLGRPGVASCAIAAVDLALWDLKARLLRCRS